jgi:hypothetical protein
LRKLVSGDFRSCCQCECTGCRHMNGVVPVRELKKPSHGLKLRLEVFKPVVLFPCKLRGHDFELSLLSFDLLPNPIGSVLQVAANVTHCFVFGFSHGVVSPPSETRLEALRHRPK